MKSPPPAGAPPAPESDLRAMARPAQPLAEPRSFAPTKGHPPRISRARFRVGFSYLAQIHQMPHTLPIAVELARRHPDIEVHLAALTRAHLDFAQAYASRFADADLTFELLAMPELARDGIGREGRQVGRKLMGLVLNRSYFNRFDALVVPERTSLRLRRLGVRHPKLIWTGHGAGDRAHGFEDEIAKFDFVIVAGAKFERRMLDAGLIRPGHYVTGVYAKFDYVRAMARPGALFDDDRPTILYNPHFWRSLSSWPLVGPAVLDWAANQTDYNLVFAPHLRLFYPPTARKYAPFRPYRDVPHMRVDLGSTASVDMTYTLGADIYLGDVSSQVAEFVIRPRPCVFLNPHRFAWRGDPNFTFWELGEVTETAERLSDVVAAAIGAQPGRAQRQRDYVADTFGAPGEPTAHIGADAIAAYLHETAVAGTWAPGAFGRPIDAPSPPTMQM